MLAHKITPPSFVIRSWPLASSSACLRPTLLPPLYATANIDAGRIRALMWEQFVLLLVLCLFYLAGWITSIRHLFGVTSDAHPDSFSSPEDDRTPVLRRAEQKKVVLYPNRLFL